jgi:addiction module HigA family antidote
MRAPIHPGEHLKEAIEATGINARQLALDLDVPANRITGILHGRRSVTADTALRLGRYFGTSPRFWLNLQQLHDLRLAEGVLGRKLKALPTVKRRGRSPAGAEAR